MPVVLGHHYDVKRSFQVKPSSGKGKSGEVVEAMKKKGVLRRSSEHHCQKMTVIGTPEAFKGWGGPSQWAPEAGTFTSSRCTAVLIPCAFLRSARGRMYALASWVSAALAFSWQARDLVLCKTLWRVWVSAALRWHLRGRRGLGALQPPTTNHQPPPTTNHQPPTNHHQPPTTNCPLLCLRS